MNENKTTTKSVHITLLALLLIQVFLSLFCITLICLWSRLLGNIMLRSINSLRAEGRAGEGHRRKTDRATHRRPTCTAAVYCV